VKATPPDNDWQRIWFSTRQQHWQSLALIPSDPGVDVLRVAESLVAVGRLHGERPVTLMNATNVQLENVQHSIESIAAMTARGEWVIVAVDPVVENPSSVAIVRHTSAAVLVLRLGSSLLVSARAAIDVIGRERFLGSVVLDGTGSLPNPNLDLTRP
jgi:hypothetical protein